MVEYCVYWLENGEPMHEVFSSLAAAEMYSCAIRGKENIEWVEVSEEETIDLDELEDMFPDDFCGVLENPPQPNKFYPISTQGDYTPGLFAGRLAWMYSHAACVYIARSVLVGQFLLFSLCSKRF